jgi:predicted RNA-binding protein with PUA-like domain
MEKQQKNSKKQQYWLMKTEPSEYSIDDLAKGKNNGMWDGVRNYQARNFLRDTMQNGDLVLIYHSSIKIPAVVGIGKIVGEPYIDPTQFNKKSAYFDYKASKEKLKVLKKGEFGQFWISRNLKLVKKFKKEVTLAEIRANLKLKNMILIKKGTRLSIQPVNLQDFNEICAMENR